ncbi:hypothetical protein P9112_011703 [Eukaryota sp. TZLM1-RC]
MDDISCIGPESTINRVANEAATLYQSIGLDLNVQKCFCISRKNVKLIINSLEVPYIDYTSTSFCFLGCYLGSAEKTLDNLENYLNSIRKELEVIKTLELEKHFKKFTQKRSIIHNAVRDCIYDLLKSAHHPVRLEPVFDEMQLAQSQKRGDIQCAWRSGQELIIDCTTVSPWKLSSSSDIESTLKNAERSKHSKYNDLLVRLNKQRGRNIVFVPIGISIFGTLVREGLSFLNDLGSFLKDSGRSFDQLIWKNRIVFSLFKALPRYFNSILLSITEFHNVRAHEPVNSENLPSFCQ